MTKIAQLADFDPAEHLKTEADEPGPAGLDWWVWAAIVGGAVTIIIIAANSGNNNTSVASPVR